VEDLVKIINERIGEIVTILFFSCVGFIIYMFTPSETTTKAKLKGALLGFFISIGFTYPVWLVIGNDEWWSLAFTASVLTISGQFVPELLQISLPKYARKLVDKFLGGEK